MFIIVNNRLIRVDMIKAAHASEDRDGYTTIDFTDGTTGDYKFTIFELLDALSRAMNSAPEPITKQDV